MKSLLSKTVFRIGMFVFLGSLDGFAYYYFIGCNGGSCPISSNPYISTGYGAMIGLLLSFDKKQSKKDKEN